MRFTKKELFQWYSAEFNPEIIAEEITKSVYDIPSIETREEFKDALLQWLRPISCLVKDKDFIS